MTFEPIDWNDDDDQPATQQLRYDGPSIVERYLAARRDAGLGHRDPDTTETERLWS